MKPLYESRYITHHTPYSPPFFPLNHLILIDSRLYYMIPGFICCFHITIHIQVSSAETAVTVTGGANNKNTHLLLYLFINIDVK
jgi:hypothetical protein